MLSFDIYSFRNLLKEKQCISIFPSAICLKEKNVLATFAKRIILSVSPVVPCHLMAPLGHNELMHNYDNSVLYVTINVFIMMYKYPEFLSISIMNIDDRPIGLLSHYTAWALNVSYISWVT